MTYLSPRELAERWGVSEQELAKARREGRGVPYIQTGLGVLYALADVLRFEARGKKSGLL